MYSITWYSGDRFHSFDTDGEIQYLYSGRFIRFTQKSVEYTLSGNFIIKKNL